MNDIKNTLKDHIEDHEKQRDDDRETIKELLEVSKSNAESIKLVIDETKGIIQLYKDMQGVVRVGITMQKVGIWLIKWPLIGAGLHQLFIWVSGYK